MPSLNKIGQTQSPGSATGASISAARNESESFQIVVSAQSTALTNVLVNVSNLTSSGGQVIPSSAIALYREYYVNVSPGSVNWQGSNQPIGAGLYADALIPFLDPDTGAAPNGTIKASPFNVTAHQNQPVWVDVNVPSSATPGSYSGTFTVSSSQGSASGSIALTVWHFTLPRKTAMHSAFGYWTAGNLYSERELLRNRIAPLNIENLADETGLIANYGLAETNLRFFSGAKNGSCTMSGPPPVAQLKAAAAQHQTGLLLFDFSADEIGACTNLYPTIKQWGYNLHQAGVDNFVTMTPNSALYDDGSGSGRSAVDIWALLPVMYDANPSAVVYVLQKGDQAWSTNAVVQDGYSPKWMIDFAPINLRIQPGFINQSLGLTGLMYWQVDRWPTNPWYNVNNTGQLSSNNYPGEGLMVYPGSDAGLVGVAPSIRLKWIRDGVDDFDYIQLLKQQGYSTFALQIANTVGANWSAWTQDPNVLESERLQLGEKLDSLTGGVGLSIKPVSVSPSSGAGHSQTFTLTVLDSNGASAIASADLLVNKTSSGANGCWIYLNPNAATLSLANDSGGSWTSAAIGSASVLSNSQCSLSAKTVTTSRSGSNLTMALPITFASAFAGSKTTYGLAVDSGGTSSSYQALGTWTAQ